MPCPSLARRATLVAAVAACSARAGAQQVPPSDVSLDSLFDTHISAASKYAQTSSAAAGSVTIVSSDDIRSFGYRNLQEILENVRSADEGLAVARRELADLIWENMTDGQRHQLLSLREHHAALPSVA